ncbi:MAG: NAD(P)-dependent oxidoreductase [Clostridiales Family XIII bacterium]|jgi:3-hydroxyisobutyrate dehydrogenase-like beta-hydroxyacid dehydrogenase|nr:NAD(P)-dependent oxidoreductase [Clostridiales Family XIII bacterium]
MAKFGWIGLGNMGNPMCLNLLKAGNEGTVWNRTKAKADEAVAAGAAWTDTAKGAAEAADFLFVTLADGPTLLDVALGDGGFVAGLAPGKVVIEMSTISVAESEKLGAAIAKTGAAYLRSPLTGSTILAAAGTVGILTSGDKAAYDSVLPLLEVIGGNLFYLGAGDQARVMKLSLNLMIATTMQMEAEAIVIAEKAGLDVAQAADIIAGSAVGSPLTGYKAKLIAGGEYAPAFTTKLMIKDLKLALEVGAQYGVKLESTELTKKRMELAVEKGWAEKDFSILTKLLEEESGISR